MQGSPVTDKVTPPEFCLILTSRFKNLLALEKLKNKTGRHKKLTKKDFDDIEQELQFFKFPSQSAMTDEACLPKKLLDDEEVKA